MTLLKTLTESPGKVSRQSRLSGLALLGSAFVLVAVSVGTLAQDSTKSTPPTSTTSKDATKKDQSKADDKQKAKSPGRGVPNPSPGANKTDTHVLPLNGQAAPGQGAIKVQTGPDGKPVILGPDGKPITPGADGKALITDPNGGATTQGGSDGSGGRGRGFGFGRKRGDDSGSPGGTISMDFRGSDINNVLKFFAMATGWQIVPDPGLTGPVTIVSPKQLTIDQAFQVLQSVLQIRGFSGQLEKRGNTDVLLIMPLDRVTAGGSTRVIKAGGTGQTPDELKNMVITEVIPIENVDATALSRELSTLINKGASLVASAGTNALIVTDVASNVERIKTLVEMLDKAASNSEIRRFALQHSDATDIANAINNLFGRVFNRGGGGGGGQFNPNGGNPGNPGGGGPNFQIPGGQPGGQPGGPGGFQGGGAGAARAAIVAVADTRTNSVLVVASRENMDRVEKLVNELDDPGATALETYTRKLKYADVLDVADTINALLSGIQPGRSNTGGNNFNQRVFGGGGFGGGGFGGFGGGGFGQNQQAGTVQSTDPFAKVVGNARTNTLYIIATKERLTRIDEMLKDLDVPVATESTTFVIPLKNVQAQDIATTLSSAFGTQTGGLNGFGGNIYNFGGGGNNNRNPNQRQGIQRRNNSSTGSGFGRAAQINTGAAAAQAAGPDAAVPGVMTPQGFVPDQNSEAATSRQFFVGGGGGFGGFGRQGQQATPLYGRGQTGNFVNLLQLRQNVGVVPDTGSNALVITTTPDNLKAIQQIIESLDVVPRQVMIEVIIAEATLDSTQKLGIQFDAKGVGKFLGDAVTHGGSIAFPLGNAGSTSGNISSPINPGGQYGVQAMSGKFNGLIQALASDNKVRILATPKIFTSNNQQAEIDVTTNIPVPQSTPTFGFGGTTTTYTSLPVGIIITVNPRITKDGLVTMEITSEDSELLGFDTFQTGTDTNGRAILTTAPRTSDRYTDTVISARDNEVVVLGGLMRDSKTLNVNKVPILGDIPLLGHLFRSTTTETVKTELMIFLVPHVVDGDAQNRAMVQQESQGIRKIMPELEKNVPQLDPKRQQPIFDGTRRGFPQPEPGKIPQPDPKKKPN